MTKYMFGSFHILQDEKKIIIESLEETRIMNDEEEADDYMCEMGYDSYCEENLLGWTYEYIE
jgi:hypothetical protein